MPTNIPWAEETWNPITGCDPVSPGCLNCYAKGMAQRMAGRFGYPKHDPFCVTYHEDKLDEPLHWRKPRMIFVVSMGDLFHPKVHRSWIQRVVVTMLSAPHHVYMLLTKRVDRMAEELPHTQFYRDGIPPNIWLGATTEDQQRFNERAHILAHIPAACHFISMEPLLGPITWQGHTVNIPRAGGEARGGRDYSLLSNHIDWVIAGCESGNKRRSVNNDNFRLIRDQCITARIPFFLKQMEVGGDVVHMPALDGQVWDQMPEVQHA